MLFRDVMTRQMVTQYEKSASETKKSAHLIPAIDGFFKSIALSPAQSLQGMKVYVDGI